MKRIIVSVLIEFGPLLTFALLAQYIPFLTAVALFILLTIAALILGYYERGGFAWFPFLIALEIVFFGLWSLLAADSFFFIIKDTVFNGAFALIIFYGVARGKGYLKFFFRDLFAIEDKGWCILSLRWGIIFLLLAVSNEWARVFFNESGWAQYKVVATAITALFSVSQFWLAKKYRLPEASPWGMRITRRTTGV
jgi:intracellular septation protein